MMNLMLQDMICTVCDSLLDRITLDDQHDRIRNKR